MVYVLHVFGTLDHASILLTNNSSPMLCSLIGEHPTEQISPIVS